MSKYPNERIIYLDIAKGIGILLVVLGHLNLEFVLKNIIYSFHMPLFFYLGGVISFSRNEIPWHNIKKFLFLYLMFGFCFACIIMIQNRSFDIELIYDMFKSNPISIYNIKWFGVFWFILAYSIVLILSKIKNFQSIPVYFLLFFIIFYMRDTGIIYMPLCIGPALCLLVFYGFSLYNQKIMNYYNIKSACIIFICFMIVNCINILSYNGFDHKIINYGNLYFDPNSILVLSSAFLGIILLLYVSKTIEECFVVLSKVLQFFGRNSLLIFMLHMFILSIVNNILIKIYSFFNFENYFMIELLKFILTISILSVFCIFYKKIVRKGLFYARM